MKHVIDECPEATAVIKLMNEVGVNGIKMTPEILIGSSNEGHGPTAPPSTWLAQTVAKGLRDNGDGEEPAQSERVFQMFQRLHTRDEFPGTGMGLPIAKKIIERHGGRI